MIVFESREVRRVVGRLERGEEVVRALVQLAREREITTAWVRAVGQLEWVELREYDPRARRHAPVERVEAPCDVVALEGSISFEQGESRPRLLATLRRRSPAGPVLFAGELVEAGAFALELVVECLDDLGLRRERDAETGLSLWSGPSVPVTALRPGETAEPAWQDAPAPEEPAAEEPRRRPPGWAEVAAASATAERRPPRPPKGRGRRSVLTEAREPAPVPQPLPEKRRITAEEFFEEPIPEKGDWVDHRVFGLCRVEGEDGHGGIIIRLPSGVRKHINLDVLEVKPARIEGERIVYPLRPRRR